MLNPKAFNAAMPSPVVILYDLSSTESNFAIASNAPISYAVF